MDGDRIRVLLIENNEDDARAVQGMLAGRSESPFDVTRVAALDQAAEYLDAGPPDAILLGVDVPGALASARLDKVHSRASDVPIIVLTSLDETQVLLDSARGGALDYLVKPRLDARDLSRTIRYAIERTHMLEARRRAEASLREVVGSSADAMVVVDAEGTVRFANPAAERLFGKGPDELVGRPFDFALEPDQISEVEIPQRIGRPAVAEMRVVPTQWEGERAYLASLRDMTESVQMREELRALSLRDDLTGLYNRRGFTTLAEQQLKLANRTSGTFLLVFADLNGLKAINDQFGHAEGDNALRRIALVLKAVFRDSDIIGRMGGDEFAVLAVGASHAAGETVDERIQKALNARLPREGLPYTPALSVGCVQYNPAEPCPLDELIARADRVMYEHKPRRRNG